MVFRLLVISYTLFQSFKQIVWASFKLLALEMILVENASQKSCRDLYAQQNCKSNENAQSISRTPVLSPYSTSTSTTHTTADTTADTIANTNANTIADTIYNNKLAWVQALYTR